MFMEAIFWAFSNSGGLSETFKFLSFKGKSDQGKSTKPAAVRQTEPRKLGDVETARKQDVHARGIDVQAVDARDVQVGFTTREIVEDLMIPSPLVPRKVDQGNGRHSRVSVVESYETFFDSQDVQRAQDPDVATKRTVRKYASLFHDKQQLLEFGKTLGAGLFTFGSESASMVIDIRENTAKMRHKPGKGKILREANAYKAAGFLQSSAVVVLVLGVVPGPQAPLALLRYERYGWGCELLRRPTGLSKVRWAAQSQMPVYLCQGLNWPPKYRD
ncbi:MAG: hypothetical protein ACI9BD_001113 [Candidatus Marinamargulisbacteria bacterium]|jgi:hypothetical protein